MKCENCGAEYRAKELKCPYCGTVNRTGLEWKAEEDREKSRVEREKTAAIKRTPLFVVNRVANTILVLSLVLLVIFFIVSAIVSKVEEATADQKRRKADYAQAKEYYVAEDFVALDRYLTEYDLYYSEDGRYDMMCEAALFHQERLDFQECWMEYEGKRQDTEYLARHFEHGPVQRMLEKCQDVLRGDSYQCRMDFEENQKYVEELQQQATLFLVSEFDYTEEDIKRLLETESYDEEFQEIVRDAYERKGWDYDEDTE